MLYVNELKLLGVNSNADLFKRFTSHSLPHSFTFFSMTGGRAIPTIVPAGILPPQK